MHEIKFSITNQFTIVQFFFIHKAKAKAKDKVRSYSYQKVTVV